MVVILKAGYYLMRIKDVFTIHACNLQAHSSLFFGEVGRETLQTWRAKFWFMKCLNLADLLKLKAFGNWGASGNYTLIFLIFISM